MPVQYIDMLVLRRMDRIAARLARELEDRGYPSLVTAAQETDWDEKRASYGRLSTRHLGIEAGLGTFGLEVNILTPEFGPRVYLTGILTEAELDADSTRSHPEGHRCASAKAAAGAGNPARRTRCCISASTSARAPPRRRNSASPPSSSSGSSSSTRHRMKRELLKDREIFGFWQGLLRVVGLFGDCPRCLAARPLATTITRTLRTSRK